MSDGRVRSGLKKGAKFLNPIMTYASNVRNADYNNCTHCERPIIMLSKAGKINRANRVDCEDENNKLVSYHLICYDIELFNIGKISTFTKLWEMEK